MLPPLNPRVRGSRKINHDKSHEEIGLFPWSSSDGNIDSGYIEPMGDPSVSDQDTVPLPPYLSVAFFKRTG